MSLVRLTRICTARSRGIHSTRCRSFNTSQLEKPYYITTPIFYPNAVPHIGHLYSLVIADIFARFQRLRGTERPVHFLAGMDEHGLKIQKAAQAKDMQPSAFCDELSGQFSLLAESAGVSNTCFMRTTSREHHETVAEVWRRLDAKGLIYKGDYSGWYSITDECFYTNSQVAQTPSQGASPSTTVSTETGSVVEWQNEQNYMFRLSSFQKPLLTHYGSPANGGIIHPPQHHTHIVQILQSGPLTDLSISRPRSRLEWGVQVPGDPEQTVYVWFDALLVYLTGRGFPWSANGKKEGWPVDLQVIGKDILRSSR
ncbi:Methionyl/Leucyl tRNA synthetase [Infundibulicybe gibba]|nr:Methionyl/Leucyl tRNA synthetase [Infundibulicybe gibba]